MRLKFLALILLLMLAPFARAQSIDSLISETDLELEQDSTQASSDVMVPFRSELVRAAHRHQVPAALLAAFCQEESGFNPWAERSEPAYIKNKKIKRLSQTWSQQHGGLPTQLTELTDRSKSMGLMQPMGEVAREQGYDSIYLSSLFSPFNSIDQGATLLHKLLAKYGRDTLSAISAYNQGSARKIHGTFENARYVYRVNVAWKHYDIALHYATTHNQSTPSYQMAGRDRNRALDTGSAQRDSAAVGHTPFFNIGDTASDSASATRYGMASRHSGLPFAGIARTIEQKWNRFNDAYGLDPTDWQLFGFIAMGMFGFVAVFIGLNGYWTRYDQRVLRHSDRHFLAPNWPKPEIPNSRSALRRS